MDNLADVVQQLRTERDQAAKTVKRLDAALTAFDMRLALYLFTYPSVWHSHV